MQTQTQDMKMELVALWVFFAILTAVIAAGKNRSVIGWALLGLIFGIFATIIIAVMKPVEVKA